MLHTLRNALPIVAAALGRKFGVEVGVGGQDACTDGRRIRIPDVPDDPASRDLAWGYLAHEAAHVRYTDFAVYEQAAREGPLQEMLQNRIEDVRIERELALTPAPGRPSPRCCTGCWRRAGCSLQSRPITRPRCSRPICCSPYATMCSIRPCIFGCACTPSATPAG
jgi:hypothetical protein